MTGDPFHIAPVRGRARIDVLDILRGVAILGIFYMNDPFMGNNANLLQTSARLIGWSAADRTVWSTIQMFWEGTQRGLLEYLFGAGAMVLTAKAMDPDGPVAIADLFYRRNLWLLAFGLIDIFLMLWIGDILHMYALAALLIFPFRKLGVKALLAIGLLFSTGMAVSGGVEYASRVQLIATVQTATAKQAAHQPISKDEQAALKDWQKKVDRFKGPDKETRKKAEEEVKAHHGGWPGLATWTYATWFDYMITGGGTFLTVLEAFCAMLIGMALWKMGIIQGQRSKRFYAVLALAAYGFGMGARAIGVSEMLTFSPVPKTIWITAEYARLSVSLGHLALVNLLVQTAAGAKILAPFKAAGRTAFSLYFCEQFLGIYVLFAPWGLNLWGVYSWAGLAGIATIVVAMLLVVSNIWVRYFNNGPLEWLWRSLSYWQRQPFRKTPSAASPPAEPAPIPA